MAVKLRLRRMGKKKRPFYRIVAADSRAPRDGRFIELVGTYDPICKPMSVELQEDRIMYWLQNGAQPTDTVKNLFQKKGVWLKWHLQKSGATEAKITEELGKWELQQKEKEAEEKATEAEAVVAETPAAPAEEAVVPVEEPAAPVEEQAAASAETPQAEEAASEEEVETEAAAPSEKVEEESAAETGSKSDEPAEDTEEKS